MRIYLASILVDDQAKALAFYTDILGFLPKADVDMGGRRWLTVVSPEAPDGTELVLEPDAHPAAGPFKQALVADGSRLHRSRWTTARPSTSGSWRAGSSSPSRPWRWGRSRRRSSTTRAAT
jgi:catechol 2,3-dioxygenase-like lactoylglutathione lyase family enzyme